MPDGSVWWSWVDVVLFAVMITSASLGLHGCSVSMWVIISDYISPLQLSWSSTIAKVILDNILIRIYNAHIACTKSPEFPSFGLNSPKSKLASHRTSLGCIDKSHSYCWDGSSFIHIESYRHNNENIWTSRRVSSIGNDNGNSSTTYMMDIWKTWQVKCRPLMF